MYEGMPAVYENLKTTGEQEKTLYRGQIILQRQLHFPVSVAIAHRWRLAEQR